MFISFQKIYTFTRLFSTEFVYYTFSVSVDQNLVFVQKQQFASLQYLAN